MKSMKVRLTFIDEVLGTASADPEIHATYIASKAPDAATLQEEVAALGTEEVTEKSMTVSPATRTAFRFFGHIRFADSSRQSALRCAR